MKRSLPAYNIGCAVVLAVALVVVVAADGSTDTRHALILLFVGWVIGWLSATIAGAVYLLPKSRQPVDAAL
jgi:hypothetical protein